MTPRPVDLAVGFFDGVHLGHRRILAGADAVLTFRNHPASVLSPSVRVALLMDADERLRLLATEGTKTPRAVRALEFTPQFAAQPPERFAEFLRKEYPNLGRIHCGGNWRFGLGGAGTPDSLRALGFDVKVCRYAKYRDERISSTRIRAALAEGALRDANAMLGRPFAAEGDVVRGKGVGRTLGFPTLNLPVELALRPGAYAVKTPLGGGVANYGVAPTARGRAWKKPVLEVHLLPGAKDCAEVSRLRVEFVKFIRSEREFPSLAALRAQIAEDAAAAEKTLRSAMGRDAKKETR